MSDIASSIDDAIREVLDQYPQVRLAILFGSTATEKNGRQSDLDLAVLAGTPLEHQIGVGDT
jgi:predicted nucleotidyltransferase